MASERGAFEEGRIKIKQLVGELAPDTSTVSISYLSCFIEHVLLLADTLHT